ncbi:hypothetical protein MRX96_039090 [Rhipicephalus microplus]
MEDIINDDDSTSWGGVADGENDQFMGGIHADFLNSMATIPRALARGENMIDRSFNSSEYLDRHLMFLRKRRQGPPPGPPSSVGRPAGPVHDELANDEQNGHPVTSHSAEQMTVLQVLKPRSPAPTTSRTPNYWDNAAEHEQVDEHATLPGPEPLMNAGENGSELSDDGTDTEQAASSSPETSSTQTSRESWVVSLSEGEEQKVPDHETGQELAEVLVDEAHFPPLDVGNAPPRDTGITPRVGSDHARTPNPLQPVVDPSPADMTPPAGPTDEADKVFPTNPTQPARAHACLGRRTGKRIRDRLYLRAPAVYSADRPLRYRVATAMPLPEQSPKD